MTGDSGLAALSPPLCSVRWPHRHHHHGHGIIIIIEEVDKWRSIAIEQTICHLSYFINIKKSSSGLWFRVGIAARLGVEFYLEGFNIQLGVGWLPSRLSK